MVAHSCCETVGLEHLPKSSFTQNGTAQLSMARLGYELHSDPASRASKKKLDRVMHLEFIRNHKSLTRKASDVSGSAALLHCPYPSGDRRRCPTQAGIGRFPRLQDCRKHRWQTICHSRNALACPCPAARSLS